MMILSGGLGTRLQSVLQGLPKGMAPIGERPFIEIVIEKWSRDGIKDFVMLLGFQGSIIQEHLSRSKNEYIKECNFKYVYDDNLLGTGGAVANAVKQLNIKENFLVINCDTWISSDHLSLVKIKAPSIAITRVDDTTRYGEVAVDEEMRVLDFKEKTKEVRAGYINSGLYYMDPLLFQDWKSDQIMSMEKDFFPEFIQSKDLNACIIGGKFIDIGIPKDYQYFVNNLKEFVQ